MMRVTLAWGLLATCAMDGAAEPARTGPHSAQEATLAAALAREQADLAHHRRCGGSLPYRGEALDAGPTVDRIAEATGCTVRWIKGFESPSHRPGEHAYRVIANESTCEHSHFDCVVGIGDVRCSPQISQPPPRRCDREDTSVR